MKFRTITCSAMVSLTLGLPALCHAVGFGVFDARTQALAGTGVAMGDLGSGHFYNPALIALHSGDEDETDDGRHTLPALTMRISDAAEIAFDAVNNDLEGELSNAIDAFNAAPGVQTAQNGERAAIDLKEAMEGVQDEDIFGDIYLGYSMTEPGHKEGGAFFVGSRVVINGTANIEPADLDLVDDYIEALRFIHTGGAEGVAHPELFLADGQLADPNDDILSSAAARVGVITEIGVSAARIFKLGGEVYSFGISPKAINLRLFDDEWQVVDGEFESTGNDQDFWFFNFDLGMIWAPTERFRVGVTSKDVISRTRTSALGYEFSFKPRTRLGFAYDFDRVKLGVDLDLVANRTFANDSKHQDMTFGVEYTPIKYVHLRAGYYHDLEATFKGKMTLGLGLEWAGMSVDMAYAASDTDSTFGLQFGFAH